MSRARRITVTDEWRSLQAALLNDAAAVAPWRWRVLCAGPSARAELLLACALRRSGADDPHAEAVDAYFAALGPPTTDVLGALRARTPRRPQRVAAYVRGLQAWADTHLGDATDALERVQVAVTVRAAQGDPLFSPDDPDALSTILALPALGPERDEQFAAWVSWERVHGSSATGDARLDAVGAAAGPDAPAVRRAVDRGRTRIHSRLRRRHLCHWPATTDSLRAQLARELAGVAPPAPTAPTPHAIETALCAALGDDAEHWRRQPCALLANRSPAELMARGLHDPVAEVIDRLRAHEPEDVPAHVHPLRLP